MAVVERERLVIYFDKPDSWVGDLTLPAGFAEMEYDEQNDIIENIVKSYQLRELSVDYWDYV